MLQSDSLSSCQGSGQMGERERNEMEWKEKKREEKRRREKGLSGVDRGLDEDVQAEEEKGWMYK